MEISKDQESKPVQAEEEREASVSVEELDAMLRGEHVLPYVRELFGQEKDEKFLPTLSTCPQELILPPAIGRKIIEMTRRTLKDTRERNSSGYLENETDPIAKIRFHLEKTSKKESYFKKKGTNPYIDHYFSDYVSRDVLNNVRIPLVRLHTHPPDIQPYVYHVSVGDFATFLDQRIPPLEVVSHGWGANLLVKCREFFDGPIYSFSDLEKEGTQLERLKRIMAYYTEHVAQKEQHYDHQEFFAALFGRFGVAFYTSNPFNWSPEPLDNSRQIVFKRINPWARVKDVERVEKKI